MNNHQKESYKVSVNIPHLIRILTENLSMDYDAPIREYIANAHDALIGTLDPKISIWGEGMKLIIEDNGIGMTKAVILQAFTRIAGHWSHADTSQSVGMFGIGVLSAFMIADTLEVITKNEEELHGWRLVWERKKDVFHLEPYDKTVKGTIAILHLELDYVAYANNSYLEDYIKTNFALFNTPIHVGGNHSTTNIHQEWLAKLPVKKDESILLKRREVGELFGLFSKLRLRAAYFAKEKDGTRIFLGIPVGKHAPLDLHDVSFFSKGIFVDGKIRGFFPEGLAFVVGLVEHADFKLQIARKSVFIQDKNFKAVKANMENHILNFLHLIAQENSDILEDILRIHNTLLVTHAIKNTRLKDLFKAHYTFLTSALYKRWDEILVFATIIKGEKVVYVSSSEIHAMDDIQGKSRDYLTVYALGEERFILNKIAQSDNIRLIEENDATLIKNVKNIPTPFRTLGTRINQCLIRKGIRNITFTNTPSSEALPAKFRIRSTQGDLMMSDLPEKPANASSYIIDSLAINIAHPLIQELAGKEFSSKMIHAIAYNLYKVAVLNAPFTDYWWTIKDDTIQDIIEHTIELTGVKPMKAPENGRVNCFVAFPFAAEFNPIWECVKQVFQAPPYNWTVIRGDRFINATNILESIQNSIKESHRCIADISGLNPNVLLELGLMLAEENQEACLVLCDKDTFDILPCDLKGKLILVYPTEKRQSTDSIRPWFTEAIQAYKRYISIQGQKGTTISNLNHV